MLDMTAFEHQLADESLRIVGLPRPVDDLAVYEAVTAATRSPKWRVESLFNVISFAASAVIVALFGGLLLIARPFDHQGASVPGGASEAGLPPVTGPAANGLIAYVRDGDIYVGDPETALETPIVAGPEIDLDPVFSPDGTRIAFLRVDRPWSDAGPPSDAAIVVVRPDGSDERVITPEGFAGGRVAGFAWLPDSASLVVYHDRPRPEGSGWFFGDLSLFDTDGVNEPRPLPLALCNQQFTCDGLGGIFRPPTGDRVLFSGGEGCEPPREVCAHPLVVMDPDGGNLEVLIDASRAADLGIADPTSASWSPDGSMITFGEHRRDRSPIYVMNADGTGLRRIAEGVWAHWFGGSPTFSPDGSRIAYERRDKDVDAIVTVVVDLETGVERELEATRSPSPFWSWSPDGRSILYRLIPEGAPATDLFTVDVETGASTALPWKLESEDWGLDSSWQRIAAE
jgi:dipeptidyl aminopeptidase/acylaminoacyl peptidase